MPITAKQEEHICYAIEHHEEYLFGKEKVTVTDIESLIVQDADNLDAIGAMGIIRTFEYGASKGRLDYDPKTPLEKDSKEKFSEFSGTGTSTIHHFYEKLFKLKNNMNTDTAKQVAEDRTKFMHEFVERYINEWNCNF